MQGDRIRGRDKRPFYFDAKDAKNAKNAKKKIGPAQNADYSLRRFARRC